MKREKIVIKRNGKTFSGEIVWPSDLAQAIRLLGELEVWSAFRLGYKELAKRRISGLIPRRKRWAKLDLSLLDDQTLAAVQVLLQMQQNKPPHAEVSPAQPESSAVVQQASPHTSQSDSDETPAVEAVQSSGRAGDFEEDWQKYLASLGSSSQRQTETQPEPLG